MLSSENKEKNCLSNSLKRRAKKKNRCLLMNFSTGWNLKRIKSCRILQIPNLSKSHPERSLRSLLPSHQIKSQGTLMKISHQQRTLNQAMLAPLQRKLLYKMRVLQQEKKMKTFQSTSQSKNLKSLKKPAANFLHSRG